MEKLCNFDLESLKNYQFIIGMPCGYDQQGNAWEELGLTKMRKKGLIVKEYSQKNVFFENTLLGYIQECLDGTWLAHSAYNEPITDIEIFGFINEFYAVRYLHQFIKQVYPNEIGDFPLLPWESNQRSSTNT